MSVTMQRIPRVVWLICAVLLVGAVLRLPYGYYNFLRIVICGASALIAVAGLLEETRSDMAWTAAFILIVVLFNPILPIRLHRSIWFYLDLMAAGVFAAHLVFCRTRRRNVQA
jgi:uncharacterized membrane protein YadS